MAPRSCAPYAPDDDCPAGAIRSAAPPVADDAAHDAVGPRARRRQLDATSVLSRDRALAAEPRDDYVPRRAPGDPAARPEHPAAGRGLRTGVCRELACRAGIGA